jgi:hypothetical protein
MSHHSRPLSVHVSGASAPDAIAARRSRGMAARRTRSLAILLVTDLAVLTAAVLTGSVLVWLLQIVLDLAVVAFVVHLRRMVRLSAAARRRAARQARDRRQLDEALAEPGWEEGFTVRRPAVEPVYVGASAARASAEGVFDQTSLAVDETLRPAYAEASDGVFDQETDLSVSVSTAPSTTPSFIEAGARPASRTIDLRDEVVSEPPAEAVGGNEWEPVPVPRPTYAMKPAAPQRPVRRRPSERLLPPVETMAEVETEDNLEAILDRRWAVND